ncbi:MAG: hypothetical protein WGN25_13170 [Candidatus Electrothrix sp. GW3-4]|uniref:TrlF family AAA-like ATPase n=1 Tax=Candidatus Electrothrix sp. GW3-4 TaxID=3126740 RepID=UPI0030D4C665
MSNHWESLGNRWLKFDFHTHTPASDDYGHGDASCKDITPEEWLKQAMLAGLDCVAVTDHNTGAWVDNLKKANKALAARQDKPDWFRELVIFPGAELTVAGNRSRIHLLAIFDPSCDTGKVMAVLGGCGIYKGYGDEQQTCTSKSFVEVIQKIEENNNGNGIAIAAHIDGAKGLLQDVTSLKPELKKILKKLSVAEFCDPHTFDKADPVLRKAVDRLAKVGGSDAHKPDQIGRHFSWIKMSSPAIEGLRLALSDHTFSVKNQQEDPNQLPESFLSKLTIQSMQHCGRIKGRPFTLSLHPHFNSIIGGRGAGKSTVLESIRIAARRDQELNEGAPQVKRELDRFMQLSKQNGVMRNETEILLEVHRRGKIYRLRWRFDGAETVLEEQTESGWQGIESGDLTERFPISIFSQKQINELAANPRGLLDIIDRSPEVNRAEWQARWKTVESRFLQLREQQRELVRQLETEPQLRAKLNDVINDLKLYEEKGHGEVLKQYQKRSQQKNSLFDDRIFDDLSHELRELAASAELSDFPQHLFEEHDETREEIQTVHEQSAQEVQAVSTALEQLARRVEALQERRTTKILSSDWFLAVQASITAYEHLVEEYEEKNSSVSISLYGEWVQERNRLQHRLSKLESVRNEIKNIDKQIGEALNELLALRTELLEKRQEFLNKVIGNSPLVRMELIPFGDASSLENEYRSLLNLDYGKFTGSVYDPDSKQGILYPFLRWEEAKTPAAELPSLIASVKEKTFDIAKGKSNGNHGAFDNRLKKLYDHQPATFDRLAAWWPEDLLQVKYSRDPSSGKFDHLEKGSAGQKAAAILAFLLSHGSDPLIMDQPEDDLDNALIYDLIVKQIHEHKSQRQLIIITHNPNIVVNGDAELVHVLKFENGQVQIAQQGGLGEATVRESVCTIMEGGRDAFEKRYKRITLEA